MVFEHIEKLKDEYTDKYVVVDQERPELRRFEGMTGTVRTVNMSGRALVEFDSYNNIGWFDIDVDYLKVIDAPLPKKEKEAEKPAKKPAAAKAEKKAAPAEKKVAGAGGMSVAEMMAAARGQKGGGAPAQPAPAKEPAKAAASTDPKSMSVADMLAAARGEKSGGAKPAATAQADSSDNGAKADIQAKMEAARKPADGAAAAAPTASGKDPKSMSVADMLAAARAEKSGDAAPAAEPAEAPEPAAPAAETAPAEQPEATPVAQGELPTEIADIVAFCRKVDAN